MGRISGEGGVMKKINHIGIAVKSLKEAEKFYKDFLKLEFVGKEEVKDQKVRVSMFKTGESRIELLEPTSDNSPIAKFIDKKGVGIHHIAIAVDDINETLKTLKANGIRLIDEKPRKGAGGHLIAFIHPKSTGGVLIELVQE